MLLRLVDIFVTVSSLSNVYAVEDAFEASNFKGPTHYFVRLPLCQISITKVDGSRTKYKRKIISYFKALFDIMLN